MNVHAVEGVVCPCPGTPHPDGDTVELRKTLGLADGIRLQDLILSANRGGIDTPQLKGQLAEAYLLVGVCGWSFVDAKGKPIPVNDGTIREHLLNDYERSALIAEEADALYMQPVLGPLLRRAARSLPGMSTDESTSATRNGSAKPRRRSKPSSTTTTLTDDTYTT